MSAVPFATGNGKLGGLLHVLRGVNLGATDMAIKGVPLTLCYLAYNTSTGAFVTGDAANHTLRWVKDGVGAAPTNAPAEVDATNVPGLYKVALIAAEMTCDAFVLGGKSATANVIIIPVQGTTEHGVLPTVPQGNNGAVMTSGTNVGPWVVNCATGNAVSFNSTGANGNGFVVTGNGTGAGLRGVGGATGDGIDIVTTQGHGINIQANNNGVGSAGSPIYLQGIGAGTGNACIRISAQGSNQGIAVTSGPTATAAVNIIGNTNSAGLLITGVGTGHGLSIIGGSSGNAVNLNPGSTGVGLNILGGATSGSAVSLSNTSGDCMTITAASGNGVTIQSSAGGHGMQITALAASSNGVYIKSAGATGVGCKIETAATAAPGAALYVLCSGVGNAYGINVAGGSTGTGLYITGQYGVAILASNGDGINSTSQAGGNGMSLVGQSNTRGADDNLGHGLYVQGLVAGDGLHATALPSGSGNGIFGAAGTNAVGMYLTAQYGLYCLSSGANGNGIYALGNGSGYGVYSSGGATGSGMGLMGGGGNANGLITNGQGSGSGIIAQCGGTGHGITAQSATGASILCVASAGALAGIQGDLGGRILGNTTTAFAGIGAQVDVEQWSGGAVPTLPTAAATATAVWQDLMAGADFGTAGSIGALLKADINAPIGSIPTNPLLASSAPANFTLLAIDSSGRMTVSPTGLDNVLIGTRKLTNYIKWSFCTTAGALPSGAGSGQENYKDADGNPGVDATIDTNGNRTAIVLH